MNIDEQAPYVSVQGVEYSDFGQEQRLEIFR